MKASTLVWRSLRYYRGANLAVTAGVAIAVSVLAGALLVGESVKASLRRLTLDRLGNTVTLVQSAHPFRENLVEGAPVLALEGIVTHQASGRRASNVAVYGVDERFWKFHGVPVVALGARQAAVSAALAEELAASPGQVLLVKIEKPSAIPAESLHGRKEDPAETYTLRLQSVVERRTMGEFSLRPQQGSVKAIFLPLATAGRPNIVLSAQPAAEVEASLRSGFASSDLGILFDGRHVHHSSGMLAEPLAESVLGVAGGLPVLTYLANSLRFGGRDVPYSLVAAVDLAELGVPNAADNAIVLNEWAASDLGARPGDRIEMEYYLWRSDGRLTTEKADFVLARAVPIAGLAADRNLSPEYPGITDADSVSNWDPPFPLDMKRVRPRDEDYWDRYKTTPKAFITLARGQQLWASRWGRLTTVRFPESAPADFERRLRARLDPLTQGFTVTAVRDQAVAASRGATNFGEYFAYFSFFLVVSALLLAGLFFRLGVEQRSDQVGLLQAVGLSQSNVRRQFLSEGALLAAAGGLVGTAGSAAYAAIILLGLGTWWVDAVGTRELGLHVPAAALVAGVVGGVAAALGTIAWTLRGLRQMTPRSLIAGARGTGEGSSTFKSKASRIAWIASLLAIALAAAGAAKAIPAAGGFFGAGALALIASIAGLRALLASTVRLKVGALKALSVRNAAYRPGRTALSAALIASATFLIVSVEAFRRDPNTADLDPKSGTGGYTLIGETVRPLYHDPNTPDGRTALNLDTLDPDVKLIPFRLRPGDDASCLNLYAPQNPRILGARAEFLRQGRFAFAGAGSWELLEGDASGGAIPAIADANSLAYVLHKSVGEEIEVAGSNGDPVRLRFVAALADSVLQGEVIIAERQFLRVFSDVQGYRVFLIDAPRQKAEAATEELENALDDQGMDVVSTAGKLAGFHRVENTYLSTFQALGGLGLLLGTAGLAAVLFRNVLERRRELALLGAIGFDRSALRRLVLGENLFVLTWGLVSGAIAAALAIAPVIAARGAQFSWTGIGVLLISVLAAGAIASAAATRAALNHPTVSALRGG